MRTFRVYGIINQITVFNNNFEVTKKPLIVSIRNPFNPIAISIVPLSETRPNVSIAFPYKLKDLEGYSFKLAMTNQTPHFWIKDGQLKGLESYFLKEMVIRQNATYHIWNFQNVSSSETREVYFNSDFSLNTGISSRYLALLPITAFKSDGFCVLVPIFPRNSFLMNLLMPFDAWTWILMFIAIFFASLIWNIICMKKLSRSRHPSSYFIFVIYGLFFGQSIPVFKLCLLQTFLLQLFVLLNFILGNAYQSLIISSMSVADKDVSINSLDELFESDITLLVDSMFYRIAQGENVNDNFFLKFTQITKISFSLKQFHDDGVGLVLKCKGANFLLADYENSKMYKVLPEKLVTTIELYLISKYSPFYESFMFYVQAIFESGVRQYWESIDAVSIYNNLKVMNMKKFYEEEQYLLKIEDFKYIFVVWVFGVLSGLFAFIGETLFHFRFIIVHRIKTIFMLN